MWEKRVTLHQVSLVCLTPATVTDGGSDVLDNFLSHAKETNLSFVRFQEKIVLPEPMLKADSAGLEALEIVSRWFIEGGVKLPIISIFVISNALTID